MYQSNVLHKTIEIQKMYKKLTRHISCILKIHKEQNISNSIRVIRGSQYI